MAKLFKAAFCVVSAAQELNKHTHATPPHIMTPSRQLTPSHLSFAQRQGLPVKGEWDAYVPGRNSRMCEGQALLNSFPSVQWWFLPFYFLPVELSPFFCISGFLQPSFLQKASITTSGTRWHNFFFITLLRYSIHLFYSFHCLSFPFPKGCPFCSQSFIKKKKKKKKKKILLLSLTFWLTLKVSSKTEVAIKFPHFFFFFSANWPSITSLCGKSGV